MFGKEEPETASVLEEVMMRSQEKELYKAIRNLPVKQRTAVVLYYFNQMSTREIAGIMGCLEGTVKSRLGQVIDGWNVFFIIQDGLVEVGDAPTQRDVVDK